jgi:hypothetical protein
MSNFPKTVAIFRPCVNGYQILHLNDDHSFKIAPVDPKISYKIQVSKDYPADDCFQCMIDKKEIYYWPSGFDLVPKGRSKTGVPIFQFLMPPVGMTHSFISADNTESASDMNAQWASLMKVIRSAALLEYKEFKDMPPLVDISEPILISMPSI